MITTTLNKIREHEPCAGGWKKLLWHLGKTQPDDEPLPLVTILDSNGLDDCLWSLRTLTECNDLWRKYAVWCARQVEHLMIDERSKQALDVAWRHAEGKATDEELAAARAAARAAAWEAARAVEMDEAAAAWAAAAAAEAALAAAEAAAWEAAWKAAWEAARAEAWEAAWAAGKAKMRTILSAGEWV